ncbi:putative UDP-glucoronosyl and UDP-glucosyl transferase [Aspergillus sclerotioniger CBS 115572]|uniref:Putative UDP-glucoronosyl and UDP-glucosyl transferase n=1 Tax=Aspergillus sclerotioniger CBS 115572 TaxID=1450535 RepID=A0A317VCU7_9EURO|nr:putative UDP-glucoronosyl and UDP-glucosyl transferase [Aspergillus sclerotioniger CBS 115572]PWY71815.1 putative UDP-glucoronosyl and UDP-glucosyl transferase [Aspergillus sclerotioniger CBS 115572]
MAHPPRKILLVVTTGGFTHAVISDAAPVLEIGKVLAGRGHTVDFATLNGQEHWINDYPFISQVHLLGDGPTEKQYDEHYLRMRTWDMSVGLAGAMPSKYMFDSFWPVTYRGLKAIMENPTRRPDFIVADFFVDAVKDMKIQYGVQIAIVMPTMPVLMLPCSYIPGQPGFQLDMTLTSEHASMWLRIKNELVVVKGLPEIIRLSRWTKRMRRENGVNYDLPSQKKPDYIVLVNSFFGLEIPRDLPPLAAAVGPILGDEYPSLDADCEQFLSTHKRVMYIALGTHIILSNADAAKIMIALFRVLEAGLLDGVIWAMGKSGRQDLDLTHTFNTLSGPVTFDDILSGHHPDFICPFFAPQRAILDHEATQVYFTHGGGSSANEGLFHGKRMLTMGIFSDQIANTARLVHGGVAEPLNKFNFSSEEIYEKAKRVLEDKEGTYARSSLRLQRVARVAARRKYYAADLIEEVMYDNELRIKDSKELRPMHLQTADVRMSAFKARNWDLMAVGLVALVGGLGGVGILGRMLWKNRQLAKGFWEEMTYRAGGLLRR